MIYLTLLNNGFYMIHYLSYWNILNSILKNNFILIYKMDKDRIKKALEYNLNRIDELDKIYMNEEGKLNELKQEFIKEIALEKILKEIMI